MAIPTSNARQMGFFCPPPATVSLKKAKIAVFFPVNEAQRLVRTSLHAPPFHGPKNLQIPRITIIAVALHRA
jgi:hypothetical protein